MIKNNAYAKTETILKNYSRMNRSLKFLEEKLERLKKEKQELTASIVKSNRAVLKEENQNYYYTDETLENSINELQQLIIKTKEELAFINKCLSEISDDDYYDIIKLWYLKEKKQRYTREQIAEYFDCDVDTITRNRKRLINELKFLLFSKESIDDLLKR